MSPFFVAFNVTRFANSLIYFMWQNNPAVLYYLIIFPPLKKADECYQFQTFSISKLFKTCMLCIFAVKIQYLHYCETQNTTNTQNIYGLLCSKEKAN